MEPSSLSKSTPILVTGATGYVASWIVKYLLAEGYTVRASVRDLLNKEKSAHLKAMAKGREDQLELVQADLLMPGSFYEAAVGCEVIIHTASPFLIGGVKDAQKKLVDPALEGTRNVLGAATEAESVKRVVLTSSVVSIYGDAHELGGTTDGKFTEEYWNVTSSLKHRPYSFSKVEAEKEAWRIAQAQDKWELVTINPGFVLGPSLTKRVDSASIDFMRSMLNGKYKMGVPELYFGIVDVRDVAKAHIAAARRASAHGRHILVAGSKGVKEIFETLTVKYGKRYPIPGRLLPKFLLYLLGPFQGFSWKFVSRNVGWPLEFDNSRSQESLGMIYSDLDQTIIDHAEQLIEDGLV